MDEISELFPGASLFAVEPIYQAGIHDREMPNGHRWLKRVSRLLVKADPNGSEQLLRLTLAGGPWAETTWTVVRINGVFCGVAEVRDHADHYFRVPESRAGNDSGMLPVEIEVLSGSCGSEDPRELAIALYGGGLVGDENVEGAEAALLRDQLAAVTMNPPFSKLLGEFQGSPSRAIEIGGGVGVLSALVSIITSADITCVDMTDYNAAGSSTARSKLKGVMDRNRKTVMAALNVDQARLEDVQRQVSYLSCSAEELPFRSEWFDFAFSLNAFEHIRNPAAALAEIERVLKPGGLAYLQFSPIFTADAGSHLWNQNLLDKPWCTLLYSREQIREMVAQGGAMTNRVDDILDSLNGLPAQYYRDLFGNTSFKVEFLEEIRGCVMPGAQESEEFALARKQFPEEDLLVQGFKVLLRKTS